MALCEFKRLGSKHPVFVNPAHVIVVDPTDGMGTRIFTTMVDRDGTPLVVQVTAEASEVVRLLNQQTAK